MGKVKCPTCKGTGQREMNFHNLIMDNLICHTCNGTGYIFKKPSIKQMKAVKMGILRGGEMINFTIYGDPKAKARPRVFSRNGRRMVFSPSARDEQDFLTQALPYKPEKPLICPLGIEIKAYFPIPNTVRQRENKPLNLKYAPQSGRTRTILQSWYWILSRGFSFSTILR